jgi:hypothetical protein
LWLPCAIIGEDMLQDNEETQDERYDLELSVLSQMLRDVEGQDVEPLGEWIRHLSDECLLNYLPKNHYMFQGLREDSIPDWYKTVPYIFNDEYIHDTIGRN